MMKKKLLSVLLCLCMVICLLPTAALADGATPEVRVAGIEVQSGYWTLGTNASGNSYLVESDTNYYTVKYETGKLTLRNAEIVAPDSDGDQNSGIYVAGGALTIHLVGTNSVTKTDGGSWRNAIYSLAALTITAEKGASLTATGSGGAEGNYGISVKAALTIEGGTITATGGYGSESATNGNYGICVAGGDLTISGGIVTAAAKGVVSGADTKSYGIFCDALANKTSDTPEGHIKIENAIVNATGGTATASSGGIWSKNDLTIEYDATGENAAVSSGGVGSKKDLTIANDATVIATGGTAAESSGLACGDKGSITIGGGTVIATGGNVGFGGNSYGIYGGGSGSIITFSGGVTVARAGTLNSVYTVPNAIPQENFKYFTSYRYAVYNINGNGNNNASSIIALKDTKNAELEGTKIAGAVGYFNVDGDTFRLFKVSQTGEDLGAVKIYVSDAGTKATRTVIGIGTTTTQATDGTSQVIYDGTPATGVVIVPSSFTATQLPDEANNVYTLSADTAIVNTGAKALSVAGSKTVNTAGKSLVSVSLSEGSAFTAGISSPGTLTLAGGGEVFSVGGLSGGADNYGVGGAVEINATTLTAYGSNQSIQNGSTIPNINGKPVALTAAGNAGASLVKFVPTYQLFIGGTQVTGLNKSNVLGDGGTVKFDPKTSTLTLSGATITGGISSKGFDLGLVLAGTNSVTGTTAGEDCTKHGVDIAGGDLTISGSGSLTATGADGDSCGISCAGALTISSTTVEAKGDMLAISMPSTGAPPKQTVPTINGCDVTANTEKSETGASAASLSAENIGTYKYIKVVPTPPAYSGSSEPTLPAPTVNAPQTSGGTTTVTTEVTPTVSGGTAKADIPASTINKAVDSVMEAAKTGDTEAAIEIKIETPASASRVEAALPAAAMEKLAGSGAELTVTTGVGDVTFDSETLSAVISAEENKAVKLSIETVKPEALTESQKAVLGDKAADAVIVDLSLTVGSTKVSELGGTATISIPCPKPSAEKAATMVVWFLADDGSITPCEGSYNEKTGKFDFKTKHFSAYVLTSFPFTDVTDDAWYYGDVAYAFMNSLMTGTDETAFSPKDTMTRAMLVTVLWRMEGEPVVNYAMSFADISEGEWYSEAVRWAASEKLVNGYENGSFGVSDPVTREQLAAILYRYALHEELDVSVGENTNVLSYTDAFGISEYAIPAMQWACGAGLLRGDNGALMPQDGAQRAQVAAILHRFSVNVK